MMRIIKLKITDVMVKTKFEEGLKIPNHQKMPTILVEYNRGKVVNIHESISDLLISNY